MNDKFEKVIDNAESFVAVLRDLSNEFRKDNKDLTIKGIDQLIGSLDDFIHSATDDFQTLRELALGNNHLLKKLIEIQGAAADKAPDDLKEQFETILDLQMGPFYEEISKHDLGAPAIGKIVSIFWHSLTSVQSLSVFASNKMRLGTITKNMAAIADIPTEDS